MAYRITVRQLESMIRISEALARLHVDDWVKPQYVDEAARLLKKSIIHVETEDITLQADEEDETVDDHSQPNGDHPMPDAPAADDKEKEKEKEREEEEGEGGKKRKAPSSPSHPSSASLPSTLPGDEGEEDEDGKARGGKKRKTDDSEKGPRRATLAYEKYKKMSNLIALYLSKHESGVKQNELVQWYINEAVEDRQIAGDEELASELWLVKRVIQRLITKDRVLLVVEEAPDRNPDGRVLVVHPNYNNEG